jgi:hypothetical protein
MSCHGQAFAEAVKGGVILERPDRTAGPDTGL